MDITAASSCILYG